MLVMVQSQRWHGGVGSRTRVFTHCMLAVLVNRGVAGRRSAAVGRCVDPSIASSSVVCSSSLSNPPLRTKSSNSACTSSVENGQVGWLVDTTVSMTLGRVTVELVELVESDLASCEQFGASLLVVDGCIRRSRLALSLVENLVTVTVGDIVGDEASCDPV